MISLYEAGSSLQQVADLLDASLYGVYYRLTKAGVVMRPAVPVNRRGNKAGRKWTPEQRRAQSDRAKARGTNHNFYVDGNGRERDTRRKREMDHFEYRLWREAVFARDAFTCQECGVVGGHLQADHIKAWALHPDLRYEVSNGRTLCRECHMMTDTFGGRLRRQSA